MEPSLLPLSDYLLYIKLSIFPQRFPSSSHPMLPGIYRWNHPSFSSDYLLYITLTIFPQRFPSSSHPMLPWYIQMEPSLLLLWLSAVYYTHHIPPKVPLIITPYAPWYIQMEPSLPFPSLIICCILHSPYSPIGSPHHHTLCSLVYTGGTIPPLPLSDYLLYIKLSIFPHRFPSSSHPMLPGIYRWNHPSFPSLIICCILHSPYSPIGSPHHQTLHSLVYTGGTIPPLPLSDYMLYITITIFPHRFPSSSNPTLPGIYRWNHPSPSPLWLSAVY